MEEAAWQDVGYFGPVEILAPFKAQIEAMSDHIADRFYPDRGLPPAPVAFGGTHAFGFMLAPGQPAPVAPEGVEQTLPGIAARMLGYG